MVVVVPCPLWGTFGESADRSIDRTTVYSSLNDRLELGCGNGLTSLTAAALGCEDVLATDVSDRALQLTRVAADHAGFGDAIRTAPFDVLSDGGGSGGGSGSGAAMKGLGSKEEAGEGRGGGMLPPADVVVVADLLYEPSLAAGVAARVVEAA